MRVRADADRTFFFACTAGHKGCLMRESASICRKWAGGFAAARPQPQIPSRAVGLSLLLGEVVQIKGFQPLQAETQLPQWQRWVGLYPTDQPRHLWLCQRADGPGPTAPSRPLDRAPAQARQGV